MERVYIQTSLYQTIHARNYERVHIQTSCVAVYNTLCVSLCYEWPTSVRIKIGKGFITEQVYLYHIIVIHYTYVQAV